MPFSTKCFYILFKLFSEASSKARACSKTRAFGPTFRLVLELELKQKIETSSCSSSNFLYGFEQARARTFCMVSSKLELELFVFFRASSSLSSNVLYGFEQARAQTYGMVSSKLELEIEPFFLSSKQTGLGLFKFNRSL